MKRCSTCKETKSITEFGASRRQKDGLHYSCKPCVRVIRRRRYERNSAAIIAATGAQRDRSRLRILAHYSQGTMRCACCSEPRIEFLTIDHIDGGGHRHRKEVGSGNKFYLWIIRNDFPDGFRVLCMNCNLSLGRRGYCPHDRERQSDEGAAMNCSASGLGAD
jgi:hypothetical protein